MALDLPFNHNQPPPGIHEQANAEQIKQAQDAQIRRQEQEQERARRQSELDAESTRRAEETSQGR